MLHICFIISPLRLLGGGIIDDLGALRDLSTSGPPGIQGSLLGGAEAAAWFRVYTCNKSGLFSLETI